MERRGWGRKSSIYQKHWFGSITNQVSKQRNAKRSWSRGIKKNNYSLGVPARSEVGIWEHGKTQEMWSRSSCRVAAPVKSAKLPKLVITKFSREVMDWPRFWSQFKAEINCSQVPAVTKFSYLKELVNPQVKTVIDGLPFTQNVNSRLKTS